MNTIIFIKDRNDFETIPSDVLKEGDVFTFSNEAHQTLENKKIIHYIAEDSLSEKERNNIFEIVSNFHQWYKNNKELESLQYDGINTLGFMDTIEFHTHLMNELINFFTIKNIIKERKPKKIINTEKFSKILETLNPNDEILNQIYTSSKSSEKLYWEKIQIKQNIGRIPISLSISRSKYIKIKSIWEKLVCSTFNLWFNFNSSHEKTIIFLEFSPPVYSELITNLRKHGFNVVFLNKRKPAAFDRQSIKLLQNSGAKIINYNKLLNFHEKKQLEILSKEYLQKLNTIFLKNQILSKIFSVETYSIWNIIKHQLIKNYKDRFEEYMFAYLAAKKIIEKIDIKCIMTLNEVGETEKSFLAANKNRFPSIMLEHGFAVFVPESIRYSVLSNYPEFNDRIAVWSEDQRIFLENSLNIKSEKIIVTGSPRHDKLFFRKHKKPNKPYRVLIAPTPITQIQGFDITKMHLRFEKILSEICSILRNKNLEIILKLHPSQSYHNDIIKNLVKKIDLNISIYLLTSVTDLIESSDAVITITPEGWGPSTIVLESMILETPIMNIILDEHFYDFSYVKTRAILIASHDSNFEECIDKLVFNDNFRNELIKNEQNFVKSYLSNPGHSSENLTNEIISFCEN